MKNQKLCLTTSFALLREAGACESGYRKLAKSLGGVSVYGFLFIWAVAPA